MIIDSTKEVPTIPSTELNIVTERVDDVPLLIAQMVKMGLPKILDRHLPARYGQRLSWGWTATIWLAYILSEGDHRKLSVSRYISGIINTLRTISGQIIEVLDFDDDRLSHLLKYLSMPAIWCQVENDLNARCIEVYELPTELVRCDPTTVSGYHAVKEDGLMQFGHSKDDPSLPQIKLAQASLDPLGMPLVTEVVSGETADDVLYPSLIAKAKAVLNKNGVLFVGDCKMSALDIRGQIVAGKDAYLSPLPLTGSTVQEMPDWIKVGISKDQSGELVPIFRKNDSGNDIFIACAYEFERTQSTQVGDDTITWQERILMVKSLAHAEQQIAGLEQRLASACQKIEALTPPVGRGKRQITDENTLIDAIAQILKDKRVEGLIDVDYKKQSETITSYIGKGRGSKKREIQKVEKIRYQINSVKRNDNAINAEIQTFGWKAFATNTTRSVLSLSDAVLCYRDEYRIERIFNRLKSRLNIAPLFVKRDDQIEGLTYLLMLGVRVLTLTEFVIRRALQIDSAKLPGLHPENRRKETDKPTAERILKAFSDITLTIIQGAVGKPCLRWLTTLSAIQQEILNRLGLGDVYGLLLN